MHEKDKIMTTRPAHSPFRRALAALLTGLIVIGPLSPAYGAVTLLADQPLNITLKAKPNIALTVDDSTSMLFDFLPDYVVTGLFCRNGVGAGTSVCGSLGAANDFTLVGGSKYFSPGYIFQQFNAPYQSFDNAVIHGDIVGNTGPGKSGPGAGCYPGAPPTCSEAIDPGALPGLAIYPVGPAASWPNSQKPYEYWEFWPAPAHNAALNALYYDPLLKYEPPVDAGGLSLPQMDDANTNTWKQVPTDPWATTIVKVDLTAPVNMGLWCNSDWSLGASTNTDVCRVNGSGGKAFSTVPAADGQDYTYPWAPKAFTTSASAGATTVATYAAQKVTLDLTLTGTGLKAAWNAAAKDPKYFFENENIIWCDPTSPSWPQTGVPIKQTCNGLQAQTCSAFAGMCQNKVVGSCKNAPLCNNATVGTCTGYLPPLCTGSAGVCNGYVGPTCTGGKCLGSSAQQCNGVNQVCNSNAQVCNGPFPQTCALPNTFTCLPPVCGPVTYDPPNCNLLPPDPENQCKPVANCLPAVCTPDPGKCTVSQAACTNNAQCPTLAGKCSINNAACMQPSDCGPIGQCNVDLKLCSLSSDCAVVGGTCSKTGQACVNSAGCPASGNCQIGNAVCLKDADCPGNCNNAPFAVCQTAATCPAKNGFCSNGITVCQTAAQCPLTGGLCQTRVCAGGTNAGGVCTKAADCPGGACNPPAACTLSAQCPATLGKCTAAGGKNGNACTTAAQCLTQGTCSNNGAKSCSINTDCGLGLCTDNTTACSTNAQCPNAGQCNTNGNACNNDNQCPPTNGICSLTNQPCTTPGVDLVNCPAVGKCSITQAQCTSNASCPQQAGPLPPNAAVCSTGSVGGVATATLRNDADNNGVVCRRNNKAAGTYTSGAYDYPSGKFLTPITNGTGVDACPTTDHWQATPRHYWKVSVEWCDKWVQVGTDDKWQNYGDNSVMGGGTCQPFREPNTNHVYPRFYQFGALPGTDNYATAAFTRVDLDISKRNTAIYNHGLDADGNLVKRTFDEEMTNYANWFAYYRTRIQAVKTVTSLTFTQLDKKYRVGLHTLSNNVKSPGGGTDPSLFVDIKDFDSVQKTKWWKELYAIGIPLQMETPNLSAIDRIGSYFTNFGVTTGISGTDPIILSCQKNWHMLFTDGFTNQLGVPGTGTIPGAPANDQDDIVPNYPDWATKPIAGLVPGKSWPPLYSEDPNGKASDSASDYAMKYWVTDLRDANKGDPNSTNNVSSSCVDPAEWQHLNFAAMSLGTQGILPAGNQSVTETLIATGGLVWPKPQPKVYKPDGSGVDDLWHAAKNGRGRFVNADSADELKLGMGQILQDAINQSGAHAGVGFQSSVVSAANKWVYRPKFEPGWGGSLAKIEIDPTTGLEKVNPIPNKNWEASAQLSIKLLPTVTDPKPWYSLRRIVTMDDSAKAVPFLPFLSGGVTAAQEDSLAPGKPLKAVKVLEWLRGDSANEGTKLGQLRVRSSCTVGENFLGDIVNSRPVYIGAPKGAYLDSNDPGYTAFVSTYKSRKPMVYVGSNDGMLHAFDDANGDESWAYIPHPTYSANVKGSADCAVVPVSGPGCVLGTLAYQDGAFPKFQHHFHVDSTPRVIDANFDVASVGGDWRSLLVGGMGKGGKSYYALDVTDPSLVVDEASAAKHVLWEFTDDNLGYTYGQPMIAKTRAFGGKWAVIVPSGYNSADGDGKVFFVDAINGKLLHTMSTGSGSKANPAGLAHIAGYTKDYQNQLVEQIYGGDLDGHFWRFDVSDPSEANWSVQEIAKFTDKTNGLPQPVTTPPQIEIDLNNGVDRWVFVGTGRALDDSDQASTQDQTLYAIRDGTANAPKLFASALAPRTDMVGLTTAAEKLNGLASKPAKGWYEDLPAGQRIITPIVAAVSVVAYVGTSPQLDPCLTGEPATLYVRQFADAASLLLDPKDLTGKTILASIDSPEGGVGIEIVSFSDNVTSTSGPDLRVAVTLGTTGKVIFYKIKNPDNFFAHRMSWRLLGQ